MRRQDPPEHLYPSALEPGTPVGRILLLGNDLVRFVETLEIARWTRRIIWQNFAGTVAVDFVGIVLAAVGRLNPTLAALVQWRQR